MNNQDMELIFNMEEAKDQLTGIADICMLLSEQGDAIAVTPHLMDHLSQEIRDICEKYLDAEKWASAK